MWGTIWRATLSALLLFGGIASLIYGAKFHTAPVVEDVVQEVVEEQQVEKTITIPHPFELPPEIAEQGGFFPAPPPIVQKVIDKVYVTKKLIKEVTKDESEWRLVREVTFGGVALLASGNKLKLKRTYGPSLDGGDPSEQPSLCPT